MEFHLDAVKKICFTVFIRMTVFMFPVTSKQKTHFKEFLNFPFFSSSLSGKKNSRRELLF